MVVIAGLVGSISTSDLPERLEEVSKEDSEEVLEEDLEEGSEPDVPIVRSTLTFLGTMVNSGRGSDRSSNMDFCHCHL